MRVCVQLRAHIVFYSTLIFFVMRIRIRMIRVFVWYTRSYDTQVRMMIRVFVYDTRIWLIRVSSDTRIICVSYVKIYASDTVLFEVFLIFAWKMGTVRTNLLLSHSSARNTGNGISGFQISKIFLGGMSPRPPYLCEYATVRFLAGSAPEVAWSC